MKTNQKKYLTGEELLNSLNKVRLTQQAVDWLNVLQTGGTSEEYIKEHGETVFDNCSLKKQLDCLTDVQDFLIESSEDDWCKPGKLIKLLFKISDAKYALKQLKA